MQSVAGADSRESPKFQVSALLLITHQWLLQEVGGTGSITAIQVKGPESDWEGMDNKWGAAWEIVHAPTYPLDIHLTNDQGQEVQRSSHAKRPPCYRLNACLACASFMLQRTWD